MTNPWRDPDTRTNILNGMRRSRLVRKYYWAKKAEDDFWIVCKCPICGELKELSRMRFQGMTIYGCDRCRLGEP